LSPERPQTGRAKLPNAGKRRNCGAFAAVYVFFADVSFSWFPPVTSRWSARAHCGNRGQIGSLRPAVTGASPFH